MKRMIGNIHKFDQSGNDNSPVSLGDRKTMLYLLLAAGIAILLLLIIRFTIL